KTEAYRKIQPFGAVPAFIDNRGDGRVLIESVAIIEYLEETRSETPLLPKDPVDRATVRALALAIGMDIQPLCSIRVTKHLGQDKAGNWSKHWLSEGFAAVEKLLEKSAGKYSFGDTITMADILLVPQFANGILAGLDVTPYPIMSRINATLGELDAFKAAHPKQQPDCPPEMR
ncbi:Glutathione S-transferase zeta-1, partial [Dissophora globulifera]